MRIRFLGSEIEILTPAKVNFFLELLGRREDGFHELETVISSVSLFDTVRFHSRNDDQIRIRISQTSDNSKKEFIPTDERNLIVRAMKLCRKTHLGYNNQRVTGSYGADIECIKRIPSEAGLGGASGNAAAAIIAANRLWQCNFTLKQMQQIGAQLGSDVPYFLSGGTAVCRGRGEQVSRVSGPTGQWIVIAKPPVGLSTKQVFGNCSVPEELESPRSLLAYLSSGHAQKIGSRLFNRLQIYASEMTDWIDRLQASFSRVNCLGHQMTGSGSSYFGVFFSRIAASNAANCLSNRHPNAKIFTCHTLNQFQLTKSRAIAVE